MKSAVLAGGLAFILSAVLTPLLIPVLHRLKFGQHIREEGPQAHLKKAGTPTMGGIAFLAALAAAALIFSEDRSQILPVILAMLGMGLTGFLDDYLKIHRNNSEGLHAWEKLVLQLLVGGGFLLWRMLTVPRATLVKIPFTGAEVDFGWLYVPFFLFVFLGTDNAVNLNDGVDGLCSSVTLVVALFFASLSLRYRTETGPLCTAVAGALLGYLLYNTYPAKLFMGDTGSLALGAFVACMAFTLEQPFMIVTAGFVYLAEIVSVMMQVSYYKLTHGKRIFRMTPIHHHFELGGWSEPRVVTVFTAVTVFLCLVSWLGA